MPKQSHFAKVDMAGLDLKSGSSMLVTIKYDASNLDEYDDDDPAKTKIGELGIRYGGLYWKGGGKQKIKRLTWPALAALMQRR